MRKQLIFTIIVLAAICMTGFGCGTASAENVQREVVRLDEDGYLYYMDYTKDYYGTDVIDKLREGGFIDTGCSSFFTYNTNGEPITCRNYDYPHRVSEEDRSLTGLNIVLHIKPEGKYESIAMADAVWCDQTNPLLQQGGPDMPGFDASLLDIIPYQCMDGINEKGLSVSILRVDIKEGDEPANYPIASSMLLRYMLDDCANVEEAIQKVDTAIVTPEDWQDCHIYVTDAEGNYAVIESRNGIVSTVESDVVTNFYLSYDDIADSYRNGNLRENALMLTDEYGEKQYKFGYGHGYHRFITIASQLKSHIDTTSQEYRTVMPESAALVILQSAAQNPYTKASGISMTQYSVIYNNAKKTLEVWSFQNYHTSYAFDVTGNRLH
ncbi:MAG: linear amide C-N hydrolase [Anaerolineaceae bacterium]|nr:linear amide C-N hydrolase [Anaerolineaceae bacterium]